MSNNNSFQRFIMACALAALLIVLGALPVRAQDGDTRPVITPDNAAQVTRLAVLGRGWLHHVGWSPDGQTLALAGSAGVWFFDAHDLSAPPRLLETGFSTWTIAYSADGTMFAAGGRDSMVRVWDTGAIAEGNVVSAGPVHEFLCRPGRIWGGVNRVAFSPDGRLLACAVDGVAVFDVETGVQVAALPVDGAYSVAFSPDGAVLAITGQRREILQLWDTQTFELAETWPLSYDNWGCDVAFSPDGALAAVAVGSSAIQVHDAATGVELHSLAHPPGHVFSLAFDPNHMLAAAGSFGLLLWDVETEEPRVLLTEASWSELHDTEDSAAWEPFPEYRDVLGAAFSPDGQLLAAVDATGHGYVWDVQTGERLIILGGYSMGGAARGGASSDWINITALAFHPDGTTLAAGAGGYITSGGWVDLWDINARTVRDRLPGGGSMEGLAYSPDGTLLATSSALSGVRLWDVPTGEVLTELEPAPASPERVAFSPDGTQLALDMIWKLGVWDVLSGEPLFAVETGEYGADYAQGVAYSPDGTLLATGGMDSAIALWDPATGTLLATLEGLTTSIADIAFSPVPFPGDPGRWLLASTTGWDTGVTRLWAVQRVGDTVSAAQLAVLEGHAHRLAFSPDGALLVTADWEGVTRLWDTTTYALLAEFEGHAEAVESLAFSADGTLLATGGWDGTIRLWGIPGE